jgi:hypothetical protein
MHRAPAEPTLFQGGRPGRTGRLVTLLHQSLPQEAHDVHLSPTVYCLRGAPPPLVVSQKIEVLKQFVSIFGVLIRSMPREEDTFLREWHPTSIVPHMATGGGGETPSLSSRVWLVVYADPENNEQLRLVPYPDACNDYCATRETVFRISDLLGYLRRVPDDRARKNLSKLRETMDFCCPGWKFYEEVAGIFGNVNDVSDICSSTNDDGTIVFELHSANDDTENRKIFMYSKPRNLI